MDEFLHIHRDRGHNSHGYSKSCLGRFNGSLYIFPFTCSMGKKWALKALLIELSNQTVAIFSYIVLQRGFKYKKNIHFKIILDYSNGLYEKHFNQTNKIDARKN